MNKEKTTRPDMQSPPWSLHLWAHLSQDLGQSLEQSKCSIDGTQWNHQRNIPRSLAKVTWCRRYSTTIITTPRKKVP